MLFAVGGLQASNVLWSNGTGSVNNTSFTSGNPCDTTCSGSTFTIFDNFVVGSVPWIVSGFDFTDFLVGTSNAPAQQNVNWSLWTGDPVNGGSRLVAFGTSLANLSPVGNGCSALAGNCLEMFTVNLGSSVTLAAGTTYFLGTNVATATGYTTFRATTDAIPSQSSVQGWEQSNGHSDGIIGDSWVLGSSNFTLPGHNGVTSTESAFDILGVQAPEPGTLTLMGLALAGLCLVRRRRAA